MKALYVKTSASLITNINSSLRKQPPTSAAGGSTETTDSDLYLQS